MVMDMTQRWAEFDALELLVGVDDHGSLSAASRSTGMAQPNASRAVQKLERRLGLPLLQRQTSGSTLTPQGTVIAHWARKAIAELDQLLVVADGLREKRSAALTVSASMTVAEHLLPRWLGTFRRTNSKQLFTSKYITRHRSSIRSAQGCATWVSSSRRTFPGVCTASPWPVTDSS